MLLGRCLRYSFIVVGGSCCGSEDIEENVLRPVGEEIDELGDMEVTAIAVPPLVIACCCFWCLPPAQQQEVVVEVDVTDEEQQEVLIDDEFDTS